MLWVTLCGILGFSAVLVVGDQNDTATICDIFADIYDCTTFNVSNICDEIGVNCTQEDVVKIDWSNRGVSGSLNFINNKFPNSLKYLDLSNNNITGEFDFSAFHTSSDIVDILINNNQFDSISNINDLRYRDLTHINFGMFIVLASFFSLPLWVV